MTCADGAIRARSAPPAVVAGGRRLGAGEVNTLGRPVEPSTWLPTYQGWLVVLSIADVAVIGCIRFHTETSWRTMDREASTKGTAAPGFSGRERAEV